MPITKPAESAYAIASMKLLPNGLVGLVIVAMFSATVSTLDVGINGTAAIIVKNIYPVFAGLFRRKLLSEKGQLVLGQVCTVVVGASITTFAVLFASNKQRGLFELDLILISLMCVPLALPMMLCLFIRKVPSWSAMFTIGIALISSSIGFFSEELFGWSWTFQQRIFTTSAVGVTAFLATMPFWRYAPQAYKEKVDYFFYLMHKPVDFAKEVGVSLDAEQFRTIGYFAVVLGLLICGLLLLPNELWGRACVIFIAGFMLCVGLIMVYLGRSALKKEKSVQMSNEHR